MGLGGPGEGEEGKTCARAWRLQFAACTRHPCIPLPISTHCALKCSHHRPPRVSGGGGRAWPRLHGGLRTKRPCAPMPSTLAHPRSHGLHPRCILAASAAVARGMECAVCAATPSCISLILPMCSARPSIQAFPNVSMQHSTMHPQTATAGSPWHGRQRAGRSRHSPPCSMSEECPCSPRPAAPMRAGKTLGASGGLTSGEWQGAWLGW